MKKIFATLLLALTTMAASAQDNPNRLIIQPKQGNPSGYLVERLDSVYFTKINGRVAADINLQGYTTGATGDTLRLAVTKTPECQAYRIACVPASMANALTSDAVVAQYFDLYVGGDKFTEDFTNAVMTNMGIEFKPNSDYSVITMGYDKYGIAVLPLVSISRRLLPTSLAILPSPTRCWRPTTRTSPSTSSPTRTASASMPVPSRRVRPRFSMSSGAP